MLKLELWGGLRKLVWSESGLPPFGFFNREWTPKNTNEDKFTCRFIGKETI